MIVMGVCATMPPNIARVTMTPETNAIRVGQNQRLAKRILLRKQKAPPIPEQKRNAAAQYKLLDKLNRKVLSTQRLSVARIIFRVEKRSSNKPAGIKKIAFAM